MKEWKKNDIQELWDNIKWASTWIIGIPGENNENRAEDIFEEIIAENFPKLMTETKIQEAHRTPSKF